MISSRKSWRRTSANGTTQVYERGVASIGVSVDLWAHFCTFKVDTCHEPDLIRE